MPSRLTIASFTKDMDREILYHFPGKKRSSEPTSVLFIDLDHTIIRPKGGRKFPKSADDWEWVYPNAIEVLNSAIADGYILYVVSNQSSLLAAKNKAKHDAMTEKLVNVFSEIADLNSLYIALACGENYYRKPHTGLFHFLEEEGKIKVDLKSSLFCGDALGRTASEAGSSGKADFSASDLYFAHNCGIDRVYTPEAFFMSKGPYQPASRLWKREKDFIHKMGAAETKEATEEMLKEIGEMLKRGEQLLIVLTGSPASGKSTLSKILCQRIPALTCYAADELKTRMEKSVKDGLKAGKSAVIDSTNPSKDARKKWLDMAKEIGGGAGAGAGSSKITPISIYIPYQEEVTHHLQHFRIEESEGKEEALPEIAIRVFKSKYERPYKVEGFEAIFEYTPYISFPKKSKQEENFLKYY